MPFNIEDFKARGLVNGGARASSFEVIIPDWPGSNASGEQQLRFMVRASQIPPSVLGQIEIPYFGRKIKVAGDRQYANWNVTVFNDEDYNLRATFEQWHENLNQHIENSMINVSPSPITYKRDGIIRHLSKDGATVLRTYTVKGIFPVQIDAIPLDWEAADQTTMFDVEFSIDYFLPHDDTGRSTTSFAPAGARNILSNIT